MGRTRAMTAACAAAAMATLLVAPAISAGSETHFYAVSLTVTTDRAAHQIDGAIVTEAPSEFCDSSMIRVREPTRGKDRVVARIFPYGGEWHMKSPPPLRGNRLYAEASRYHLPSRPVICEEARSRTFTAP